VRKSKLEPPHVKQEIVKRLASGESQYSIAKEVGLNRSTVCRFANRGDIRRLIEQEQRKLIEVVPDAVENVKSLVREMKEIPQEEIKRRELSYKASKDVLKSVGILPTPAHSQTFIDISQENNQIISPVVWQVIDSITDELTAITEDT
jgi:hypothetical protein